MAATPVDEAIGALREQTALTREEYDALTAELKSRAWYVARVQNDWVAGKVRDAQAEALEAGEGPAEFQERLRGKLSSEASPLIPWHAEVVYYNNAHTVYNAARMEVMERPAVRAELPVWAYVIIDDARTSDICLDLQYVILPCDDPRWRTIFPPNHDYCRSGVQPLTEAEGAFRGIHDFTFREGVYIPERFATNPRAFLGM